MPRNIRKQLRKKFKKYCRLLKMCDIEDSWKDFRETTVKEAEPFIKVRYEHAKIEENRDMNSEPGRLQKNQKMWAKWILSCLGRRKSGLRPGAAPTMQVTLNTWPGSFLRYS